MGGERIVNLLTRRREMMGKTKEFWDFEWDYTKGKLEEQPGWTVDKSASSASTTLTSNAERFETGINSYYQCYIISNGVLGHLRNMTNGVGVLEATFSAYLSTTSSFTDCSFITAETKQNRIRIFAGVSKFRLKTASATSSCRVLANFENNTEYTIKIVCKGTTADFYINNSLIENDIPMNLSISGTSNCVIIQGLGNGYYVDLKSFKLKVGSLV